MIEPKIIDLFRHVDDRGVLDMLYDSDLPFDVKRIYTTVSNYGVIRGLHGHLNEWKAFYVAEGLVKFVIFSMKLKNPMIEPKFWDNVVPTVFTLSAMKPQLLILPPEFYHGYVSVDRQSKVFILSSATLEETKRDDFRISPDYFHKYFEVHGR